MNFGEDVPRSGTSSPKREFDNAFSASRGGKRAKSRLSRRERRDFARLSNSRQISNAVILHPTLRALTGTTSHLGIWFSFPRRRESRKADGSTVDSRLHEGIFSRSEPSIQEADGSTVDSRLHGHDNTAFSILSSARYLAQAVIAVNGMASLLILAVPGDVQNVGCIKENPVV